MSFKEDLFQYMICVNALEDRYGFEVSDKESDLIGVCLTNAFKSNLEKGQELNNAEREMVEYLKDQVTKYELKLQNGLMKGED